MEVRIEDNVKPGDNVELVEVNGVYVVRRLDKKVVFVGPTFIKEDETEGR